MSSCESYGSLKKNKNSNQHKVRRASIWKTTMIWCSTLLLTQRELTWLDNFLVFQEHCEKKHWCFHIAEDKDKRDETRLPTMNVVSFSAAVSGVSKHAGALGRYDMQLWGCVLGQLRQINFMHICVRISAYLATMLARYNNTYYILHTIHNTDYYHQFALRWKLMKLLQLGCWPMNNWCTLHRWC